MRVGLNQDLFTSGEDLADIMDALRWTSPRMSLAYSIIPLQNRGGWAAHGQNRLAAVVRIPANRTRPSKRAVQP